MIYDSQTIRTWSFYREQDGSILGRHYSAPTDQFLEQNTPAGCVAIEGRYDRERQRMDLQSRRVIDDAELARMNAEKRTQAMRGDLARTRIEALERQQLRPLRELAIDPTNAEARTRLAEIDAQIATLRTQLE